MDQEAQQRIMGFYIEEARDHLMNLEQGLVSLRDRLDDSELINDLFRAAHSIKGGAAMLGLGSIQKTAHRLEDTFKVFREREVPVDDLLERLLLQAYDSLARLLEQLQTGSLTETSGEAVVQAAEPTFDQLEHHLQVLLGEASPAAAPVAVAAKAPDFNQVVSQRLRDMLEIVKKGQPDARQNLQAILTTVAEVGAAYIPWQNLVATIQAALAVESNDLRMLALVFLRDLKAAQQLILEGQVAAVQPSADLLAKLPTEPPTRAVVVVPEPVVEPVVEPAPVETIAQQAPDEETADTATVFDELTVDADAVPLAADPWAGLPEANFDEAVTSGEPLTPTANANDPWIDVLEPTSEGVDNGPLAPVEDVAGFWDAFDTTDGLGTDDLGVSESSATTADVADLDSVDALVVEAFTATPDAEDPWAVAMPETADPWDTWENDADEPLPAENPVAAPANTFDAANPYDLNPLADDPWTAAMEAPATASSVNPWDNLAAFGEAAPTPSDPLEDWLSAQADTDDTSTADPSVDPFEDLVNLETGLTPDVAIANLERLEPTVAATDNALSDDPFGAWLDEPTPEPSSTAPSADIEPMFLDDLSTLFASDVSGLEAEWQGTPAAADDTELGDWMADLGVENDSAPSDPDTEAEMLASIFDTPPPPVAEPAAAAEDLGDFSDLADLWNTPADSSARFMDEAAAAPQSASTDASFAELNALFAEEDDEASATTFDADLASLLADESVLSNGSNELELPTAMFSDSIEALDWTSPAIEPNPLAEFEAPVEFTPSEAEAVAPGVPEAAVSDLGFDLADLSNLLEGIAEDVVDGAQASVEAIGNDPLDSLFAELDLAAPEPVAELPMPAPEVVESLDFGDLEAMLSDSPDSEMSAADTEMDALTSLLDEPAPTSFDELESLLGSPAPAKPSARPAAAPPPPARSSGRAKPVATPMMRVEVKYLDTVNNLVGELVVSRNSLEQTQGRLRQFLDNLLFRVRQLGDIGQKMQDQYERSLLESSLVAAQSPTTPKANAAPLASMGGQRLTGESFDALEMDRFTAFHSLSQEVIELIVRIRESASDIEFVVDESEQTSRQFRQITTQLQEGLNRVRMVPFSQIADRLPRAVKDLSFKTGKQISLAVDGRDILIDKSILEELYDPMTHLVNNAIVHGIEDPAVRTGKGKPAEGTITIRTFYQGNQTIIAVSDDGGGINAARVKQKAVEKGMITAEQAALMDDQSAYELLGQPGFSTQDQADELAGRGVGLDVVVTTIREKMRGTVQIDSELGKGTTFTLRLPLTLSVSKAMVCISDRALVAFPLDGVEEMIDVPRDQIQKDAQGRDVIPWRDQTLHFQPLSQLLSFGEHNSRSRSEVFGGALQVEDIVPVVILQSGGQRVALQVDNFVEEQEIVIKQLGGPVPKPDGIAGATVLGNGRVLPIADTLELIDMAMGRRRKREFIKPPTDTVVEVTRPVQPTVLIIDDSITVRELLSMTFAKVGYRVEQARDGQDAWDKLRGGLPCDLVFCDIEMPKMDGLEFLSRVREDGRFTKLPIAMLTSRGADRHRQMAASLGATAYFTKPYLEEELLSAANRMLQGDVLLANKA